MYEWLGILAGTLTTASFLPQVIKVFRTRQTSDLSLLMYALFCVGVGLWFVYSLYYMRPSLLLANGITLVLALCILVMKLRHG